MSRLRDLSYAAYVDPPAQNYLLDITLVPETQAYRMPIRIADLTSRNIDSYVEQLRIMIDLTEESWQSYQRQRAESKSKLSGY